MLISLIVSVSSDQYKYLRRSPARWVLGIAALLCTGPTQGQEAGEIDSPPDSSSFSLFEEIEVPESAFGGAERDVSRRGQAATAGEPEFTLLGTSRIGDRYSAILRHRGGAEVVIVSRGESEIRIEGFEQYAVLRVESGRVAVRYPADTPCVEFADVGSKLPWWRRCHSEANTR